MENYGNVQIKNNMIILYRIVKNGQLYKNNIKCSTELLIKLTKEFLFGHFLMKDNDTANIFIINNYNVIFFQINISSGEYYHEYIIKNIENIKIIHTEKYLCYNIIGYDNKLFLTNKQFSPEYIGQNINLTKNLKLRDILKMHNMPKSIITKNENGKRSYYYFSTQQIGLIIIDYIAKTIHASNGKHYKYDKLYVLYPIYCKINGKKYTINDNFDLI